VGAFAGSTTGAKLGYDVTHEIFRPEPDKAQAGANPIEIAEHLSKKSGEKLGETLGTAGGAILGTVIAGPAGGMVGALAGGVLGGQLGEDTAVALNQQVEQQGKPSQEASPEQTDVKDWTIKTGSSFVGETGSALVGGAIGKLVAGAAGAEIGRSLGALATRSQRETAGKKIDWTSQPQPSSPPQLPQDAQEELPHVS